MLDIGLPIDQLPLLEAARVHRESGSKTRSSVHLGGGLTLHLSIGGLDLRTFGPQAIIIRHLLFSVLYGLQRANLLGNVGDPISPTISN